MTRFSAVLAAAIVAAALAPPAHAQSFPNPKKPIRIIVPTAPAGGNDAMARIVAQKLNERLKQPVIVENKSGANGAIGSEFVAKAPPDGYTILFGYIATHGINPGLSKLPYDAVKDFAPIAQIAEAPVVLVVNPSVQAKTVQELIALAKAKPGALSYASAGNGTAPHIAAEMFKQMAGIDMVHVPYKGSSPGVTDTIAGQTQVMFPSLVAASGHMKTNKLRGVAISSKSRSKLFPSLPTVSESGLKGFEITQWYGFFAPAKTPKETVDFLNREIVAVMKDPDTQAKFAAQGAEVVTGSPEAFGKLVQSEIAKWSQLIKSAKITAD
ncbi:MAG: tripartite tricarboxylate transporter substrate binding protein [Bacteroidota bacterium]